MDDFDHADKEDTLYPDTDNRARIDAIDVQELVFPDERNLIDMRMLFL